MLKVRKRSGKLEDVSFDKVTNRIKYLVLGKLRDGTKIGHNLNLDYGIIARDVITNIIDGIETSALDEHAARVCASKVVDNHNYSLLAGRIAVSNHHKNTIKSFFDTIKLLYENKDKDGNPTPLINRQFYKVVLRNANKFEDLIEHNRDYVIDYFGFKTLEKSYLLERKDSVINVKERPQHCYLRVAIAIHKDEIELVKETYDLTSQGYFTHASPTMYNAGTNCQQLSSCFLLGIADSMDDDGGIPDCWKSCSKISKRAGGIGVGITPIRSRGSRIRGTNGDSDGIVPMLKVFNDIARYVNQGGRRNGSFVMYLEPWHPDTFAFLDMRKAHGKDEERARDLFYALWIPDIFMKRVKQALVTGEPVKWSFMCPDASHIRGNKRLYECHSEEFEKLYLEYEEKGLYIKQIPDIRTLWNAILSSQKETGTPYMLYKDSINRKNNQKNLGVIRNSNLCAEIVEYSDSTEHAVCNLGSIALPKFVKDTVFDYEKLLYVTKVVTCNLNKVIDINYYPTKETRKSNIRHRPIGLGIQGLADVFALFEVPFGSEGSRKLNKKIAETIYFGTMSASMEIAKERTEGMNVLKKLYNEDKLVFKSEWKGIDLQKSDLKKLITQYPKDEPVSVSKFYSRVLPRRYFRKLI